MLKNPSQKTFTGAAILSTITLSIKKFIIKTFTVVGLFVAVGKTTPSINDTQHSNTAIMLIVVMLIVMGPLPPLDKK